MIGITPAAFTFKGINCLTPPYCLFPTTLLAYCTGILLVPCTKRIVINITNNNANISTKKITKPPPAEPKAETNSCIKD